VARPANLWTSVPMNSFQAMKLFVRVVDLGSFSKAAADLGMGQPSATKLVAQLERQLGARLLFRSTHGVRPTEVGTLYYDKCKLIAHHLEEAETVASLMQSQLQGGLRISTTMDFGRRILTPLVTRFLQINPRVQIELLFDDHIVDIVEQGIDVAIRMGRLANSSLGARYLGQNPWSVVASPGYLARRGRPLTPSDLSTHDALVISTVQNDSRWHFLDAQGRELVVHVCGPMRSNNKSALLTAACCGLGIATLPTYVVNESVQAGSLVCLLDGWSLPTQEVHAVYPSPRMVPTKVVGFVDWLKDQLNDHWWTEHYDASAPADRTPAFTLPAAKEGHDPALSTAPARARQREPRRARSRSMRWHEPGPVTSGCQLTVIGTDERALSGVWSF
jgi:DNA-binding transcriptional LysR family regulator